MTAVSWRWHLVGDDAVLVDLPDADAVAQVSVALGEAPPEGVVDVVPAARTVLVRGSAPGRARWAAAVRRVAEDSADAAPGPHGERAASSGVAPGPDRATAAAMRVVEIPVAYDGADLADVAALARLTPDEVVARHVAGRYRVAFGGFMPGFAYLTGLDPALVVPRLATPRTRVPPGAVAIAGQYAAVYPRATPGGWRLIGTTDVVMFDPTNDERPALLAPGDEVRFVPARAVAATVRDAGTTTAGRAGGGRDGGRAVGAQAGWAVAAPGPAGLEILATGASVLVEDAGRPGRASVGVPRSGVAAPGALRAANRLVGNRADAAVLEVVLGGLVVRFRTTTAIALVGAPVPAEIDGVPVPPGRPVRVPAGAVLSLGIPPSGLRTWLAVRGGIDVPAVLGSRSTDVLSGIGPALVTPGDTLPVGHAFDGLPELPLTGRPDDDDGGGACGKAPPCATDDMPAEAAAAGGSAQQVVLLPATPGPRADRLTADARARLSEQVWTVGANSNRIALRLDGPPLSRVDAGELASEGLVIGAVQVPHDGRPVVFGPDHPVTGGYPVVAVLTPEGIARAAQRRPGDLVRLAVGGW